MTVSMNGENYMTNNEQWSKRSKDGMTGITFYETTTARDWYNACTHCGLNVDSKLQNYHDRCRDEANLRGFLMGGIIAVALFTLTIVIWALR